jgi:ABC-type nitrate/sulfonate/bicarbonate transport system ATPase subunit
VIEISGVSKYYRGDGDKVVHALDDIDLEVRDNEFITLLGPSGCGKTTLLRAVAGLNRQSHGSIKVDGEDVKGPSPERAMVFQNFALLPWATVVDNIAFGLQLAGMKKAKRREIAAELAALVGLQGFEGARPAQLSGGMQQRVGLARALAVKPKMFLMDEPFGALDEQTKRVMQDVLLKIWERQRTTVLFVTHSIDEALLLADRVVVLSPRPGRIHKILDVPLPRPRTRDVELDPAFVAMKADLWDTITHLSTFNLEEAHAVAGGALT